MYKIVEFSHTLIEDFINKYFHNNMILIDATCGRGNDTIFMANLIKQNGHVYSYDIQEEAINYTNNLLSSGNIKNVTTNLKSHENILENEFDLVIFNLGYLPQGDKTITTKHETSLIAIQNLVDKMKKFNHNALIIIVLYPGHKEGLIESKIIDNFVKTLPSCDYLVTKFLNYNRDTSPFILTISKNIKNTH